MLFQHAATLIISVDWSLVSVVGFPDYRLLGAPHQEFAQRLEPRRHRLPLDIVERIEDAERKQTILLLQASHPGFPVDSIHLDIPHRNFYREVVVEGSYDSVYWTPLQSGEILYDFDTPRFVGNDRELRFGEYRYRYYRITIFNEDNPPLPVQKPMASGFARKIVFATGAGETYRLYYGNPEASAPSYELEKLFPYLVTEDLPVARLGPHDVQPRVRGTGVPARSRALHRTLPMVAAGGRSGGGPVGRAVSGQPDPPGARPPAAAGVRGQIRTHSASWGWRVVASNRHGDCDVLGYSIGEDRPARQFARSNMALKASIGIFAVVAVLLIGFLVFTSYYFGVWPKPSLTVDDPAISEWLQDKDVIVHRRASNVPSTIPRCTFRKANASRVFVDGIHASRYKAAKPERAWLGLWQPTTALARGSWKKASRTDESIRFASGNPRRNSGDLRNDPRRFALGPVGSRVTAQGCFTDPLRSRDRRVRDRTTAGHTNHCGPSTAHRLRSDTCAHLDSLARAHGG